MAVRLRRAALLAGTGTLCGSSWPCSTCPRGCSTPRGQPQSAYVAGKLSQSSAGALGWGCTLKLKSSGRAPPLGEALVALADHALRSRVHAVMSAAQPGVLGCVKNSRIHATKGHCWAHVHVRCSCSHALHIPATASDNEQHAAGAAEAGRGFFRVWKEGAHGPTFMLLAGADSSMRVEVEVGGLDDAALVAHAGRGQEDVQRQQVCAAAAVPAASLSATGQTHTQPQAESTVPGSGRLLCCSRCNGAACDTMQGLQPVNIRLPCH